MSEDEKLREYRNVMQKHLAQGPTPSGIERVMHNGRFIGTIEPHGDRWVLRTPHGARYRDLWISKSNALEYLKLTEHPTSDEVTLWELSL